MPGSNPQSIQNLAERIRKLFKVEGTGDKYFDDTPALRYVLYARKSTDDSRKQERSIGDQLIVCKEMAERLNLNVVEIIHEEHSAKESDSRPKFRAMLDGLLDDKYDAILTWAPDRLARNMKDGGEIVDMVDRGEIKDIKFANGMYFTNDPTGKMMLGMAFVQAKQFIDTHSQNIQRGINNITKDGKSYGQAKHGYYKDGQKFLRPDYENWEKLPFLDVSISVHP